jgi:MFS family permease
LLWWNTQRLYARLPSGKVHRKRYGTEKKFGLDLAAVNAVFAVASLGTAAAILAQPALARRFGRIGSIVLVQGASITFIVVLGFSPVLWTVVVALTLRNSLMNARQSDLRRLLDGPRITR